MFYTIRYFVFKGFAAKSSQAVRTKQIVIYEATSL